MIWKIFRAFLILGLWLAIAGGIYTAYIATELPDITADVKFERKRAFTFLAHDGTKIATVGELKGETITTEDLPQYLIHALLATEDRRFYSHFGVDPVGILRAMATNIIHGRLKQGGSTLTQQLAKNLFLTPDRTLKRKLQEAILAVWLETQLTKDEILSAYLNRVYFGSGAYGVQAASDLYFNKNVRTLDLQEAAMLVGLLKAPSRYSPLNNPELAEERMNTVLAAMKDAGYDYKTTSGKLRLAAGAVDDTRQIRYFTDWLFDEVNLRAGAIEGNLIVETTLDTNLQDVATKAMQNVLENNADAKITQGAAVVLQNDGAVRAMVGGRNYGLSQFNRATQALRPPGSSFKPFVFLTALNRGWRPGDLINDAPITTGSYKPQNFGNEYFGEVTLLEALTRSMNTATVRLAEQIGIGYVIGTARKVGITTELERDLSLALGSSGVPLIEMTSAYTVFPNQGRRPPIYAILSIRDAEGNIYYEYKQPRSVPVLFEPRAIMQTSAMLESVINNGTGQAAQLGRPAGGKTGTSQDHRDAWFIGFTNGYTTGVWLGNDDNSPMKGVTGGSFPARAWKQIMLATPEGTAAPTWAFDDPYVTQPAPSENTQQTLQAPQPEEKEEGGFTNLLSRILGSDDDEPPAQERELRPVEPETFNR